MEVAFLGVHRDAGIIAHMLVGAGCDVEQGCLAAVGIAHQGDTDIVMAFLGHVGQGLGQALLLLEVSGQGLEVFVVDEGLAGLLLRDDLDLTGLLPAQGNFIADDFVFNGIAERRVQHHPYLLPLDESHFNEPLAETSVAVHAHDDRFLASG